jgi:hypothetical protein
VANYAQVPVLATDIEANHVMDVINEADVLIPCWGCDQKYPKNFMLN